MPRNTRRRRRIVLLLGAAITLAIVAVATVSFRAQQKERLLADSRAAGLAALEAGDYEPALKNLGYYVARVKDDPDALLAYAEARAKVPAENQQHLVRAAAGVSMAADAAPEDPRPYERLVELYGRLGFYTEQLDAAEALLELEPNHRAAMWGRINALFALGRREEALAAAEAMLAAHPSDGEAAGAALELMIALDRPSSEIRAFADQLASSQPDDPSAALARVRALQATGDLDSAREAAREVAALPHKDAEDIERTLRLLDALGLHAEGDALLDQVRAGGGGLSDSAVAVAAERAWKDGRTADARSLLAGALQTRADWRSAPTRLLGWAALAGVDTPSEDAIRAELQARESADARGWTALLDGRQAMRDADWKAARESLATIAQPEGVVSIARYLLGVISAEAGDDRAAAAAWRRLARTEPNWFDFQWDLTSALVRTGDLPGALRAAQSLFNRWPDRLSAAMLFAEALTKSADAGRMTNDGRRTTEALLDEIVAQSPVPDGRALRSQFRLMIDDVQAAEEDAQALLADESLPGNQRLLDLLETAHIRGVMSQGSTWNALLDRALDERPGSPAVVRFAALRAADLGDPERGEAMLEEAIEAADQTAARRQLRLALLELQLATGSDAAQESYNDLIASGAPPAEVAQRVLQSSGAWDHEDLVRSALSQLQSELGAGSVLPKYYEARSLLTYDRSEDAAAKAFRLLDPILQQDPNNHEARVLLAEALLVLGDRLAAADELAVAIDSGWRPVTLYPRLIQLLQAAGEADEAERRLRAFLQVEDLPQSARRSRVRLLMAQGMWQEALAEARRLAQDGDQEDLLLTAGAYERLGEPERAAEIYQSLLSRDEGLEASTVVAAARFLAMHEDVEAGVRALEHLPGDVDPDVRRAVRADLYASHGRTDAADTLLQEAAAEGGSPRLWAQLATQRARRGEIDAALDAIRRGLAQAPEDPELRAIEGLLRLSKGEASVGELLGGLSAAVPGAGSSALLALLEAIERAEEAASDDEALDRFERVANDHPRYLPAWRALVMFAFSTGRAERAVNAAIEASRANPTSSAAHELAAHALAHVGRYDEALAMARTHRQLLSGDPFNADLLIAALEATAGRPDTALSRLEPHSERLSDAERLTPSTARLFAGLLAGAGRIEEAEALFDGPDLNDPMWRRSRLRVAEWIEDQPDVAAGWIERAAPPLLDDPRGRLAVGEQWHSLALASPRESYFRKVVETLDPLADEPDLGGRAALLLASAHQFLGEYELAKQRYRDAAARGAATPEALNNLAYLLLLGGDSPQEALELVDRALAEQPQDPILLDTRGAALLLLGQFQEAAATFSRALRLAPSDPALLLGSALAEAELGRLEDARMAWSRYRSLRIPRSALDVILQERLARLQSLMASEPAAEASS